MSHLLLSETLKQEFQFMLVDQDWCDECSITNFMVTEA